MRTAPAVSECAQVHVELGLTETSTIRETSRWVGYGLESGLRIDVFLNDGLQIQISITEEINQNLQSERRVSGPRIVI